MIPKLTNNELDFLVKQIKKQRNTYIVTFCDHDNAEQDHKFTEDQMVEYRITLNKWFTKEDLELIVKSSNFSRWYNKALNYIFIKLRTEKEIWTYLSKSDLDFESKQKIINKLLEYKYLDDEEYIKAFLEDSKNKCLGRRYIVHTLERLGISQELISIYLSTYQEEEFLEQLISKYQKIEKTLISLPTARQKLKLTEKMALKGISTTIIQEVLRSIEYNEDIEKTFNKDLTKIKKQTNDKNKTIQKLLRLGYTYDYIKRHIDV